VECCEISGKTRDELAASEGAAFDEAKDVTERLRGVFKQSFFEICPIFMFSSQRDVHSVVYSRNHLII